MGELAAVAHVRGVNHVLKAGDTGQAEMVLQPGDTAKVLALSSEDSFRRCSRPRA
jgi:hypothetical protein